MRNSAHRYFQGLCLFVLLAIGFTHLLLVGCSSGESRPSTAVDTRSDFEKGFDFKDEKSAHLYNAVSKADDIDEYLGATKYGYGVYYLPYRSEKFGRAFSLFKEFHPEYSSVCGWGDSESSDDVYFSPHFAKQRRSFSAAAVSRHAGYWLSCSPYQSLKE